LGSASRGSARTKPPSPEGEDAVALLGDDFRPPPLLSSRLYLCRSGRGGGVAAAAAAAFVGHGRCCCRAHSRSSVASCRSASCREVVLLDVASMRRVPSGGTSHSDPVTAQRSDATVQLPFDTPSSIPWVVLRRLQLMLLLLPYVPWLVLRLLLLVLLRSRQSS